VAGGQKPPLIIHTTYIHGQWILRGSRNVISNIFTRVYAEMVGLALECTRVGLIMKDRPGWNLGGEIRKYHMDGGEKVFCRRKCGLYICLSYFLLPNLEWLNEMALFCIINSNCKEIEIRYSLHLLWVL